MQTSDSSVKIKILQTSNTFDPVDVRIALFACLFICILLYQRLVSLTRLLILLVAIKSARLITELNRPMAVE